MALTLQLRQVVQMCVLTHLQSAASEGFPSITALVTFAVSHLPLSVYCVSLKCVIAASWRLPLSVVTCRGGGMAGF